MMADARKFSRKRREIKLTHREDVERDLNALLESALRGHDPTVPPGAVKVIAELLAVVGSQLLVQTQATQRTLTTMNNDIADYGSEFVVQLIAEAKKDLSARVKRTTVVKPTVDTLALADDWAGPVAGPTLIERHFGIPRSTLYRWQRRGEAVALNTRTSRKPVFPLRQFVDGRPAVGIAEVVAAFSGDQRAAWQWLISATIGEGAALDCLLEGRVSEVLKALPA